MQRRVRVKVWAWDAPAGGRRDRVAEVTRAEAEAGDARAVLDEERRRARAISVMTTLSEWIAECL